MNKKTDNKNKVKFKVTLRSGLPRQTFIYNPNRSKKIYDKNNKLINTISNNGKGVYYNIKLTDGEVRIFDTEKQAFMIEKLLGKNVIVPLEQWEAEQENIKFMEEEKAKEDDVNVNNKTSIEE